MLSSVLALIIGVSTIILPGCGQETFTEPEIPAHFTAYTDEEGLFSISYHSDWELYLSGFEGFEQVSKETIRVIMADAPLEIGGSLFMARVPTEMGWDPNVNVMVQWLPGSGWTVDRAVEEQFGALKDTLQEHQEFSRVKTIIDGMELVIIDYEAHFPGDVPGLGIVRGLQMSMVVGNYYWTVSVGVGYPERFEDWEDNFHGIVRSLRILK